MPPAVPDPASGRTLVLCPIGIGNFIMATPALKALSDALGPERVSLLALKSGIASLGESSGLFGTVFAWDPDAEGLRRGVSLLRRIRRARFTHSLALFPASHWKFCLFQALTGARFRTGFRYPHQRMPQWVQHRSLPPARTHDTLQNLNLVEAFLGEPRGIHGQPFWPGPRSEPAGLPAGPFFACHPGSSAERGMAAKRLPPGTFAALIRRVHRETGWPCVLVGGPEEHALRAAVAMDCRDSLARVEPRSLAETAGVLGAARFFLGNDSGLMHIAAALGTRCAAYFGPTDERRTGPFGYWESRDGTPRHLILRRRGADAGPAWTLDTIGANPPLEPGDAARWNLDPREAARELLEWVRALAGTGPNA